MKTSNHIPVKRFTNLRYIPIDINIYRVRRYISIGITVNINKVEGHVILNMVFHIPYWDFMISIVVYRLRKERNEEVSHE